MDDKTKVRLIQEILDGDGYVADFHREQPDLMFDAIQRVLDGACWIECGCADGSWGLADDVVCPECDDEKGRWSE